MNPKNYFVFPSEKLKQVAIDSMCPEYEFVRQCEKSPKYFCTNCFKLFQTGRFDRKDSIMYEDVCPNCGAIGLTFEELSEEYKDLALEYEKLGGKE